MPIEEGTQFGPYRIVAPLGEGGMGVVYRALDTKLNRDVAVKFLSNDVADAAGRRRFQREAQMASSLNHPHIVTVHDVGEFEGRQYLVTEFVDGGTLREWIRAEMRGARAVLDLLTGVADGLAAAHAAGILHRDIKPANILVAKNGYAKLADFGLARLEEKPADALETVTEGRTKPGTVMGTIAYMSPEQASGRPLDARSDIFSFGIVLYEALAGKRPFGGGSELEVLQQIIHGGAAPLERPVPAVLRVAVEKALEKEPADRYQNMRELVIDLKRAQRERDPSTGSVAATQPAGARRGMPSWIAAAGIGLAGLAGWLFRAATEKPPAPQTVQVQRLTDLAGLEETPAISPDGKTVAFVSATRGKRQIWVRLLAGGAPLAITKDDADHYGPRWSPDSASLMYYTPGGGGAAGGLWQVPALGGDPQRLQSALGPGDISHSGREIAFLRFQGGGVELAVASREQPTVRTVTKMPPASVNTQVRWSPDDRSIAFLSLNAGASFSANLMVADAAGGAPRLVAAASSFQGFAWIPDGSGWIVSSAQDSAMQYPPSYNLWRIPRAGGPPAQLTFGESSYEFPDAATTGNVVVSRVRAQSDVWKFPVTGAPAENARRGIRVTHQTGQIQTVTVSPDETEAAVLSDNSGHANVWVTRLATGEMRALTRESDPRIVVAVPLWSPRGDWIQFLSSRNSPTFRDVNLWVTKADGSATRDLGVVGVWAAWSGDGQWLYFTDLAQGVYRIRKIRPDGGEAVTVRDDNAVAAALAADGSALYYGKALTAASGTLDFEIRAARPESGPSQTIGRLPGPRVPVAELDYQSYLSPDGKWLATPLLDGSTTNLWALPTAGGDWRRLTDFGARNVMITRRIAWSKDGKSIYAAVADVDSDVVMLSGLK